MKYVRNTNSISIVERIEIRLSNSVGDLGDLFQKYLYIYLINYV